MRTFLPFMCTALVIHTASMATEGMLLAGTHQLMLPCLAYLKALGKVDVFLH